MTRRGALKLKHQDYESDHTPIEDDCSCFTCKTHTRSYLSRLIRQRETVGCHLISIHNIAYQMRLMRDIRDAIQRDDFSAWIQQFMKMYYHHRVKKALADDENQGDGDAGKQLNAQGYPIWIANALNSVNISLLD